MIFETHILENTVANYVESMFYCKGCRPSHSIERVVPTGCDSIIIELDGFEYHTCDTMTLKPNGSFRNVWVSEMHENYLSISTYQDSEMLVMQWNSGVFYPINLISYLETGKPSVKY